MSNKYRPHVVLIPEDDANRQLALGFRNHAAVADTVMDIMGPAGGWSKVLDVFECEYIPYLRKYHNAHLLLTFFRLLNLHILDHVYRNR